MEFPSHSLARIQTTPKHTEKELSEIAKISFYVRIIYACVWFLHQAKHVTQRSFILFALVSLIVPNTKVYLNTQTVCWKE